MCCWESGQYFAVVVTAGCFVRISPCANIISGLLLPCRQCPCYWKVLQALLQLPAIAYDHYYYDDRHHYHHFGIRTTMQWSFWRLHLVAPSKQSARPAYYPDPVHRGVKFNFDNSKQPLFPFHCHCHCHCHRHFHSYFHHAIPCHTMPFPIVGLSVFIIKAICWSWWLLPWARLPTDRLPGTVWTSDTN